MKLMKTKLLYILCLALCACSSDDDTASFDLANKTYKVVAFETEVAMDLNGDGIFSTDMDAESDCSQNFISMVMSFSDEGTVRVPMSDLPTFKVENDVQMSSCAFATLGEFNYTLIGNTIEYEFDGQPQDAINSTLINNNSIIIFTYSPSEILSFVEWSFFNESLEEQAYTGNFIITLELQD
jgi:hypothetical protein